ncbi:glycosyltransferase family 2 protein [Acidithiobacillus sp. IBUN Pt1247-S3]|uniref:glycosyltransferase family 2 protein n=1 Tax=Acidithiobacillus sp. IBUN Pt1247-S3 TaxID=3166642 RepID=UPI0034E4A2BD
MTIFAVIVTFNPQMRYFERLLTSICSQVDGIVVVDNASNSGLVGQIVKGYESVVFVALDENLGIAAALNIGFDYAISLGADYVITLDQDSVLETNLVKSLLSAYLELIHMGYNPSVVGSRYRDISNGEISDNLKFTYFRTRPVHDPLVLGRLVPVDFVITSGSFLSLEVYNQVGPMREELFIDHVDTEWVLRASHAGFQSYSLQSPCINHSLGEFRKRVWFGRWRNIPFHKPFRYYYIFRNAILVMKQENISKKWKIMETQRMIKMAIFMCIMSPERLAILRYMMKGVVHGLRGIGGKLREN